MTLNSNYLTAAGALKIVERQAFPIEKILNTLIRKVEYKIRIIATLKGFHCFWSVPFVYVMVPAYDTPKMTRQIFEHLVKQNFHVRVLTPTSLWISWRFASQKSRPQDAALHCV